MGRAYYVGGVYYEWDFISEHFRHFCRFCHSLFLLARGVCVVAMVYLQLFTVGSSLREQPSFTHQRAFLSKSRLVFCSISMMVAAVVTI